MGASLVSLFDTPQTIVTRSIPHRWLRSSRLLELERPTIVSVPQLTALIGRTVAWTPPRVAIQRARGAGWLLPTGVRGMWEFAPGERAGAFSVVIPSCRYRPPSLRRAVGSRRSSPASRSARRSGCTISRTAPRTSPRWRCRSGRRSPPRWPGSAVLCISAPRWLPFGSAVVSSSIRRPRSSCTWHIGRGMSAVGPASWKCWGVSLTRPTKRRSTRNWRVAPTPPAFASAYLLSGVAPALAERLEPIPRKVWFGPRRPVRHHDAHLNVADTVLPIPPRTIGASTVAPSSAGAIIPA